MNLKVKPLNVLLILASLLLFVPSASAAGGDFSLDFIASAPFTYDHSTGGGAYNDRTVGKYDDVVESLQGGDFVCFDTVTYLTAISVNAQPADVNQTIELYYTFLADTTGQTGAAHGDISYVGINYGDVENGGGGGLGSFAPDTGMVDDGGSTATIISEEFSPAGTTPFNGADDLNVVIQVDDLEAGEQVILRIDTLLDCLPGSNPTGNLQGKLSSARVVVADGQPVDDAIPGGAQTIPFKQIGNIEPPPPAAVTLASFSAIPSTSSVRLEWETSSELDNLGFNVYRAESAYGLRTRLNASLIPAQAPGSAVDSSYQFVDETVAPGTTYYYWLEDVDVYGVAMLHGPISAETVPLRRLLPARPRPAPTSRIQRSR